MINWSGRCSLDPPRRAAAVIAPSAGSKTLRILCRLQATSLVVPHSAYHFDGRNGRFFEGWYFKVATDLFSSAVAPI